LVSERLAWSIAVLPETGPNLDEWLDGGHEVVAVLRGAMHGTVDPGSINEYWVREWQKPGQDLEKQAASLGLPSINQWLKRSVDAPELVREVAQGIYEPDTPEAPPADLGGGEALTAELWLEGAAAICMSTFDPPAAEFTLKEGTYQLLGRSNPAFEGMGQDVDDDMVVPLSSSRMGFALRNLECQWFPGATSEIEDWLTDRVEEHRNDQDFFPHPGLDPWLIDILKEAIDDRGGLEGMTADLPGAPVALRESAIEAAVVLQRSDDCDVDTARLILFGYLLHRVNEVRSIFE